MISIGRQVNHKTFQNCVHQSNSKLEERSTPPEQHLYFRRRYTGDILQRALVYDRRTYGTLHTGGQREDVQSDSLNKSKSQ
jgi:hypothetical protein